MLTLISPAKVNLFLRVLGKRTDGYHEIASLFQAIDLADTLRFSFSKHDRLTCSDSSIPVDSNNLIWKAAEIFRRETRLKFNFNIDVEKKIPIQAGLGGGSSNAATTLWGLNQLLERPATLEQIKVWGSEIGSDVPFFLSEGTAYCTGRGEIIQSLPPLAKQKLTIIKPFKGLPTPLVYKQLDCSKLKIRDPAKLLEDFFQGQPQYFNDLEEAAFLAMPELVTYKNKLLSSGFKTVLLSGSGSAFFCLQSPELPSYLENCAIFPAQFIRRLPSRWY
jgi:4-diphosphocytidyl-2-C-methyl-D-erythritol kinase